MLTQRLTLKECLWLNELPWVRYELVLSISVCFSYILLLLFKIETWELSLILSPSSLGHSLLSQLAFNLLLLLEWESLESLHGQIKWTHNFFHGHLLPFPIQSSHHNLKRNFTMPIKLWPQILHQVSMGLMTKDQSLCMVQPAWFILYIILAIMCAPLCIAEGMTHTGLFFIIIFLTVGGRPGGWQESPSSYSFLPLAASASPPDTTG